MSIRKRGQVWHVDIDPPGGGQRIRHSTGTSDRQAAQEYHDRLKNDLWKQHKLGEKGFQTWEQAAVRWLEECGSRTDYRSTYTDALKIKVLTPHLQGKALKAITRDFWTSVLETLRENLVAKKRAINEARAKKGKPAIPMDPLAMNATMNRYSALVSAILNRAVREWEWLDMAPTLKKFEEHAGRKRWITPEQAMTLLKELPEHLREPTLFSLMTGLRQANVFLMEWSWIDLQTKTVMVPGEQFKNGDDHGTPLTQVAIEVIRRQIGKHSTRVFTYEGNPIRRYGLAWKKALNRAGIADFRWHDLRHTWASWLRQNGESLDVIEKLGGWKDSKMPRRYSHISTEHLAPHVAVLDRLIQGAGGNYGTFTSHEAVEASGN